MLRKEEFKLKIVSISQGRPAGNVISQRESRRGAELDHLRQASGAEYVSWLTGSSRRSRTARSSQDRSERRSRRENS
jgi:hypothetical protein